MFKISASDLNVHFSTAYFLSGWQQCIKSRGVYLQTDIASVLKHIAFYFFLWRRAPQQTLRTHRSLEAYCATL
jgi:hypothetical protein